MKIITYLSLIAIAVGMSLGIGYFINQQQLGATVTTILSTDQLSDFVAVYNTNNAALNNAIHWSVGSDYLYASSSPTFGIILGPNSSSTIGNLTLLKSTSTSATTTWMYISGSLTNAGITSLQAASTTNLAITGITGSTQCLQINTNGTITGHGTACNVLSSSWEYDLARDAMVTTSTKGFFMTASSTVHNSFRVDGSATTTGSFYLGGDLTVGGDFLSPSYYATNTPSSHSGQTESTLMTTTIKGGDMGVNSIVRITFTGTVSGASGHSFFGVRYGGQTIATSTEMNTIGSKYNAVVDIRNRNSLTSQLTSLSLIKSPQYSDLAAQASSTALSINTANDQTLLIIGDSTGASGEITIDALDIQFIK